MTQRERERAKENTEDQGLNKKTNRCLVFDDLCIKSPMYLVYQTIITIHRPRSFIKKCFHLINNHILSYKWQRPQNTRLLLIYFPLCVFQYFLAHTRLSMLRPFSLISKILLQCINSGMPEMPIFTVRFRPICCRKLWTCKLIKCSLSCSCLYYVIG